MTSLKAILPDIGPLLGMTHHTLYVRQQSLTREGLLVARPGRGPGSGVVASPETVATMLVAVLAGLSPADVAHQTRAFCAAVSASGGDSGVCPFTGRRNFKDALAAILADERMVARIDDILVAPSHGHAFIRYDAPAPSAFTGPLPPPPPYPQQPSPPIERRSSTFVAAGMEMSSPLTISVTIYGQTLQKIAAIVSKLEADQ